MSPEDSELAQQFATDCVAIAASLLIGAGGNATEALRMLDECDGIEEPGGPQVRDAVAAGIRAAIDGMGRIAARRLEGGP